VDAKRKATIISKRSRGGKNAVKAVGVDKPADYSRGSEEKRTRRGRENMTFNLFGRRSKRKEERQN